LLEASKTITERAADGTGVLMSEIHKALFGISKEITLGKPEEFEIQGSPDTLFEPQVLKTNAPCPMLAYIGNLSIAGLHIAICGGWIDVHNLQLTLAEHKVSPKESIKITAMYSGYIPPGFSFGQKLHLSFTFKGTGYWE
jgi:hypothetical protein